MKKSLLLFLLLLFSITSFSQESKELGCYVLVFKKDSVCTKKYKFIIEPQFDELGDFNGGLAEVKKAEKWGFIDKRGKFVIDLQFDEAWRFNNDLAVVRQSEKWGIIDKKGKFIINPQFDEPVFFYEGLSAIKKLGKWGFIDKSGKFIIKPQFDEVNIFNEGLATVKKLGKWGFIDKSGKFIINLQFDEVNIFNEGLSTVKKLGKWGIIDKKGKFIINPQFDEPFFFNQGLAGVKQGKKWGYIDMTGKFIINLQFDEITIFNQGLAGVKQGKKWGYIDMTGKFIINPQFDEITVFNNGLAGVKQGEKWGYIDMTGKFIINPRFDEIDMFNNGLADVKQGEKWGFIDMTGRFIINPRFEDVRSFNNGLAIVKQGEKWGFIKECSLADEVKEYVTEKVNQWQLKGEFEKTADYRARVNNETRNQRIKDFTQEIIEKIKSDFVKTIVPSDFELGMYDADHETFLIHSKLFSDFAVSVPTSEASSLKQNWSDKNISLAEYDFRIANSSMQLAKLSIINSSNNKKYVYDSKQPTTYSMNNITYHFDPINVDVAENKNDEKNNLTIESQNIEIGKSDVDINIPSISSVNNKTFAVIIANENYQREAQVCYAKNDGETFKKYCIRTLGLPKDNVHYLENATLNNIRAEVNWIANVANAYNGEADIILYYAGHGIPDENTKAAYLLPIDGYSSDVTTGYKLEDLYDKLGTLNAKEITLFMDACFSGSQRGEGMLTSARGVAVKIKQNMPSGNIVAFSATKGDETAYPYNDKGHGLFTYFLLKKLQETKGNVTLGELSDYITTNVKQQSIIVNRKSQTPTTVSSVNMFDKWKNMKLK